MLVIKSGLNFFAGKINQIRLINENACISLLFSRISINFFVNFYVKLFFNTKSRSSRIRKEFFGDVQ